MKKNIAFRIKALSCISIVVLVFFDKIGALCFFLAYLLHLFLDWPDIDRKYYFYPFKIKFKGFLQVWSYQERVITLIFFGMISALAAITLSINGQHLLAIVFLAASIFFDYFDKNAALYLRIKNRFGKELDSLVGLIAFVVAPAIFVITQFSTNSLLLVIAAVFMSCGIYRLVRFHWDGRIKTGGLLEMPIALNGIIFPLIYLVWPSIYIYEIMLLASSIVMVIKIKANKS